MPIHGVDISRYQDVDEIDGWSFAIVNVEDPGLGTKIRRCRDLGIPWGLYTWIYPGNGRADMRRAIDRAMLHGEPPMGYWLDYEQAGVTPNDLGAALDCAADHGVFDRTGVYTYLYQIAAVAGALRGRPLWLAYYPRANDGTYHPDKDSDARGWNAVMWQYTSGGNLDRNVIIDEAWYQAWTEGEQDMTPDQAKKLDELHASIVFPGDSVRNDTSWTRAYLGGATWFPSLEERIKQGIAIPHEADVDENKVASEILAVLGPEIAEKVVEELARRLAASP